MSDSQVPNRIAKNDTGDKTTTFPNPAGIFGDNTVRTTIDGSRPGDEVMAQMYMLSLLNRAAVDLINAASQEPHLASKWFRASTFDTKLLEGIRQTRQQLDRNSNRIDHEIGYRANETARRIDGWYDRYMQPRTVDEKTPPTPSQKLVRYLILYRTAQKNYEKNSTY